MKLFKASILTLSLLLYSVSTFAQHGHAGGSMGPGDHAMNHTSTLGTSEHQPASLSPNSNLSQKIQTLTGMKNTPAQQICGPFKNLGQCVAAAHVSNNLHIPFACMESAMLGQAVPQGTSCPTSTTNKSLYSKPMSLGRAITNLEPTANAGVETKKANKQADQDINNSKS
jgi:hypothetical protein